ncbi:hypothetical protein EV363DRAFT_1165113 [Boletus edulis]|nr:hypothetical protein EV363DRAFT_1165113 [Boletus edulis]
MLVLPALHTYLSQLLSPPSIHTALLLTPEGALVSYASQTSAERPARQKSKDDIRIIAGLGAEVWAETRDEEEGMVESELGRILVLAVEDGRVSVQDTDPLLLLAVNGTLEADWDAMPTLQARKLTTFLAPSVNKHRGMMGATVNGSKSRTRSTATSPGRGFNR